MAYDASRIRVLEGFEAVRRHPKMFFGKAREDPELLTVAFSYAVQDSLVEEPSEASLQVRVVVNGPRAFSVEDNGPGLSVDPADPGGPPAVTEMMTRLMCGQNPMRRWGMAMVTALCTDVVADVWHYRQRADRTAVQRPLEVVGDSDRHGTRVAYRLDDDCLNPAAKLPSDLTPLLLQSLFALPFHYEFVPRPGPVSSIELVDRRNGTRVLIKA
ncbi:hypothetical protein [Actinomadura sp. 9N407]|uniref:hypothetical protein n=1 Tax=Actinomadura sp. 9N407 TaxID=3375154 RepID=UPI0037A10288